jgi:dTDP-4-dehydrorhamnose reductase
MKIYILGSKGMLGKYVYTYLSQKFNVSEINRDILEASQQTEKSIEDVLINNGVNKGDVIINCIGTLYPTIRI